MTSDHDNGAPSHSNLKCKTRPSFSGVISLVKVFVTPAFSQVSQSSVFVFSFTASAEKPDEHDQHSESSIDAGEYPWLGLVKEDLVQPVLDKRLGIVRLTGPATQRVFPNRQWTELPEPGLQNNDANCRQMRESKYSIVNPSPVRQQACQNEYESDDDEYDERKVNNENGVRQKTVQAFIKHSSQGDSELGGQLGGQ